MTDVIDGEFDYPFEITIKEPRHLEVVAIAHVKYTAERYIKDDGWFIEHIYIRDIDIEEAYDEEGNNAVVETHEVSLLTSLCDRKNSDDLVDKAIDDAMERDFWS